MKKLLIFFLIIHSPYFLMSQISGEIDDAETGSSKADSKVEYVKNTLLQKKSLLGTGTTGRCGHMKRHTPVRFDENM